MYEDSSENASHCTRLYTPPGWYTDGLCDVVSLESDDAIVVDTVVEVVVDSVVDSVVTLVVDASVVIVELVVGESDAVDAVELDVAEVVEV